MHVANTAITDKNTEIKQSKESIDNLISNLSNDEKIILQIIYADDIAMSNSDQYIKNLTKNNGFKRVKVQALLSSLVNKDILSLHSDCYDTTDKGRKIILELFEKGTVINSVSAPNNTSYILRV